MILYALAWASMLAMGASALGINCRGSENCMNVHWTMDLMLGNSSYIDDNAIYAVGDHILCIPNKVMFQDSAGFCMFMQASDFSYTSITLTDASVKPAVNGSLIKQKIRQLHDHSCRGCGSVPLANTNNPDEEGILVVNFVGSHANSCMRFDSVPSYSNVCPPTIPPGHYLNPYTNTTVPTTTSIISDSSRASTTARRIVWETAVS